MGKEKPFAEKDIEKDIPAGQQFAIEDLRIARGQFDEIQERGTKERKVLHTDYASSCLCVKVLNKGQLAYYFVSDSGTLIKAPEDRLRENKYYKMGAINQLFSQVGINNTGFYNCYSIEKLEPYQCAGGV